ncbi:N-acetylmannosamine-6-phosphate 2-epimerase [Microbacterium xylanilyticum]
MTSTPLPPPLTALAGGVVVSCQAYPGEPMRSPETMAQVAASAMIGGAAGIRAQGPGDIALIRDRVALPLIGLWKAGSADVFITPTLRHAIGVHAAGADVIALDGTRRERPDGLTLAQTIRRLKDQTGALVMADTGSLDDALAAVDAGADCIGTTLAGYTPDRPKLAGPDLELIALVADAVELPVIAEGRIHTPAQAAEAMAAGAFSVVVGTAITHPASITRWFADAVRG